MQARLPLTDLEEQPPLDAIHPPGGPLLQNFTHAHHPGHPRDEDIEIAGKAVLQRRHAEQLLHQLLRVHSSLQIDGQLQAAQVGLIPHVGDLLDLSGFDQLCHPVHDDFRRGGIRDLSDLDQVPVLLIVPLCAQLEAAPAGGIHLPGRGLVKQ